MCSTNPLEIQQSPTYHPLITITPSPSQSQATPALGRAAEQAVKRVGRLPLDVTHGAASTITHDTMLVVTQPKRRYRRRARRCRAPGCNCKFVPRVGHGKFCSSACRQRAHRAKLPKRLRQPRAIGWLTCVCCGSQYVGTIGVGRRYCEARCKRRAARARRAEAAEALAVALNMTVAQAQQAVELHGVKATRLALATMSG